MTSRSGAATATGRGRPRCIVDKKGVVRYTHIGEGAYSETEQLIRRSCRAVGGSRARSASAPDLRRGLRRRRRAGRARLLLAPAVGGVGGAAVPRAGARHGGDGGREGGDGGAQGPRRSASRGLQAARARRRTSARTRCEAWKAQTPALRRVYLFDRQGRLLYPVGWTRDEAAVFAALLARDLPGLLGPGRAAPLRGRAARCPGRGDPRRGARARAGRPSAATRTRSAATCWTRRSAGSRARACWPSLDEPGRPVYTSGPLDGAERVLTVPLRRGAARVARRALPAGGRVAARHAVRRQAMIFIGRLRAAARRDRARARSRRTGWSAASRRWRGSSRTSWPTSRTTSRPRCR